MLLAQITDLHVTTPGRLLDSRYRTAEHLERAVAHLVALDPRPDAVAITGDLVEDGEPAEYARLLELIAPLPMPVHVIPGNHDGRDDLRAAFRAAGHLYLPADGFLCYEAAVGPLRLIALDTNIPGAPGGRLCGERLAWLEARLAEQPDRPTIILQHHPPFATGMRMMDAMGLEGRDDLAAIVARHPQVERILCGHLHRSITRRFAGTIASTCPSTAHQVALDLRPDGGLAVVAEPPACALHTWTDGGLVSHLDFIGSHGAADVVAPPSSARGGSRRGNLRAGIPPDAAEELVTPIAAGIVRMERIVSRGHASPPGFWYEQEEDELVLVTAGAARLELEGEGELELGEGDWVDIGHGVRHRVNWTAPDRDTIWFAVYRRPGDQFGR